MRRTEDGAYLPVGCWVAAFIVIAFVAFMFLLPMADFLIALKSKGLPQ